MKRLLAGILLLSAVTAFAPPPLRYNQFTTNEQAGAAAAVSALAAVEAQKATNNPSLWTGGGAGTTNNLAGAGVSLWGDFHGNGAAVTNLPSTALNTNGAYVATDRQFFLDWGKSMLLSNVMSGSVAPFPMFAPGATYAGEETMRDVIMTMEADPNSFTSESISNRLQVLVDGMSGGVIMPDAFTWLGPDDGWGYYFASPDSSYDFVHLMYITFQRTADPVLYNRFAYYADVGISYESPAAPPASSWQFTNDVPWMTNKTTWGFTDQWGSTGYDLVGGCLRYRAIKELYEMAAAAGSNATAAAYFGRLQKIADVINTNLYDNTRHLYYAASISPQVHHVPGSAMAVLYGVATASIASEVEDSFINALPDGSDGQSGKGFYEAGAVRHMPADENLPGDPTTNLVGKIYQYGGYWPSFSGWAASVIARKNPAKAEQLLAELRGPCTTNSMLWPEWWNFGGSLGVNGSSNYLTSAANPAMFILAPAKKLRLPVTVSGVTYWMTLEQ